MAKNSLAINFLGELSSSALSSLKILKFDGCPFQDSTATQVVCLGIWTGGHF